MKANVGLLFMRVSIGLLMLCGHGWPKLMHFSEISQKFPDVLGLGSTAGLGLAVFSEFFCSIALIVDLKVRWAAVPLLITMLVALFFVHGGDPWKKQEFVILYIIPYISLFLLGGGDYTLERVLYNKRAN